MGDWPPRSRRPVYEAGEFGREDGTRSRSPSPYPVSAIRWIATYEGQTVDQRALVEQARRGDHDAFAVLAGDAIARLDAAARLILRDRELAKDVVQETL